MAATTSNGNARLRRWRMAGWAVAVLLTPLVAMQFDKEVNWTGSDFLLAAILIGGACVLFEVMVLWRDDLAYCAAVGVGLAAAFLLVWAQAAVGYIGAGDDPANLMFAGVLAVPVIGAFVTRLRAGGMACALAATGVAHAVASYVAFTMDPPTWLPSAVFCGLWFLSAALFRIAARSRVV